MNIKTGDTVRFLNATGGGIVTRIDSKKGLVYVEDADGFEIPTLFNDCVVVPKVNENTNFPIKDISAKADTSTKKTEQVQPTAMFRKEPEPVIETADGDKLNILLAFFPVEIKQLQTTSYDCYLVNDCNYFLFYNIINGEGGVMKSVVSGVIEPNMQEEISSITKDQLNEWENLRVQIIPFKKGKPYSPQQAIDKELKINAVKFYKLHSFTTNDYFDEPCMLINLTDKKDDSSLLNITASEIKEAMYVKDKVIPAKVLRKSEQAKTDVLEIDLHIDELVDTTAGMSNGDMLELQLEKFHHTLDENKNNKGRKIVFIHGKGEGVLRKEIERLLKTRYKSYYYQDASFREYGFGATMVTIK